MPAQIYWSASIFKNLSLAVTPQIGMAVTSSSTAAELDLVVTPQIGFTLSQRVGAVGLSATPQIGMAGSSVSVADLDLSVTPQIGMVATGAPEVDFTLGSGAPQVGMAGAGVSRTSFTVGPTPHIGMVGAPGSRPPTFDAIGAGSGSNIFVGSLSWSHTATTGAYAIVDIVTDSGATPASVTYGGVTMTSLGSVGGALFRYGLANVAGGAKTVSVTFTGNFIGQANSISYLNVGVVGSAQTTSGTTSVSQSVTCPTGQIVVEAIGVPNLGSSMTVAGGNDRYAGSSGAGSLAITDNSSSATFTASAGSGNTWYALANVLAPITTSGSAALTLTPSITAAGTRTTHGSVTRSTTPLITASGTRTTHGAAALTTTPSIIPVGHFSPGLIRSTKAITPTITAGGVVKSSRGSSLTVTPNIGAAGQVTRHRGASLTVTPAIAASGTVLSGVVTYDATGAGANVTSPSTSASWSHTAAAGAAVLVSVTTGGNVSISSVQWGATSMTLLGSSPLSNVNNGSVYVYGLTGAGTGSAVTVTVNTASNTTISANSVSYINAGTFGTAVTNAGSGTTLSSGSVSSSTSHMAFCAFGFHNKNITGFSGTQRFNYTSGPRMAGGDAAGAATVSFSATGSGSDGWGSVALDII